MAWTKYQKMLALAMVVTGSINTLSTKWADVTEAVGKSKYGKHKFDHPFLQAVGMFLGEFLCFIVFNIQHKYNNRRGVEQDLGNQGFNRFIFLPAALCDMLATSLMYVGLNLTFPSSFQMLRGAVIIFTALLSVAFLGRNIRRLMWIGMICIILGLILVGVADLLFTGSSTTDLNSIIAGDLLIVMAQIIVAVQMVYEERFVTRLNIPPLQAVGWEGIFGFIVLGLLQIPFYFIIISSFDNNPEHRLEDAIDAFKQMGNSWQICLATLGNIVSIAFFNFSGISVTKEISATTRMVLDSVRTIVVWVVSAALLWQPVSFPQILIQIIGFIIIIVGMCVYNDIIIMPLINKYIASRRGAEVHNTHVQDNQSEEQTESAGENEPLLRDHSDRNL